MSNLDLSHLKWALATNRHNLKNMVLEVYKDNPEYLTYLDELVYFLRSRNCKNIREKLDDVSQLDKFRSVCSELEIARALVEHGKLVAFLPDNYMNMVSPPDLLVKNGQIEIYVEVKRIKEDGTSNIIFGFLRQFLPEHNYPYIVDIKMNETMSIPAVWWYERQLKKLIVEKSLQEFESQIATVNPRSLPAEIETNIGMFQVRPSPSGRGYPRKLSTSGMIPWEKLVQKIRDDVVKKAKKRDEWSSEHRAKYYLVALDFEEIWYKKDYLEVALIGNTDTYSSPLPMSKFVETDEVKVARERGWEAFLHEKHILPRDRTYLDINKRGVFFTEPAVKNVSGVLGKFRKTFYFVPNPFAFEEINDPRLVSFI